MIADPIMEEHAAREAANQLLDEYASSTPQSITVNTDKNSFSFVADRGAFRLTCRGGYDFTPLLPKATIDYSSLDCELSYVVHHSRGGSVEV